MGIELITARIGPDQGWTSGALSCRSVEDFGFQLVAVDPPEPATDQATSMIRMQLSRPRGDYETMRGMPSHVGYLQRTLRQQTGTVIVMCLECSARKSSSQSEHWNGLTIARLASLAPVRKQQAFLARLQLHVAYHTPYEWASAALVEIDRRLETGMGVERRVIEVLRYATEKVKRIRVEDISPYDDDERTINNVLREWGILKVDCASCGRRIRGKVHHYMGTSARCGGCHYARTRLRGGKEG